MIVRTFLQSGAYDIAVHSLKDMPTSLPPGLVLAAVSAREDPRDAVVLAARYGDGSALGPDPLAGLPPGSIVGTSSLRREAFLRRAHPHLVVRTMRGNLNTRLRKLDAAPTAEGGLATAQSSSSQADETDGRYDVLVLATAGLLRLGWGARITRSLPLSVQPCAVGQGALGVECRADDELARTVARSIVHPRTLTVVSAERAFLRALQGGCQVPIGVHSYYDDEGEAVWERDGGAGAAAATPTGDGRRGRPESSAADAVVASPPRTFATLTMQGTVLATLTMQGTVLALDGSREVTAVLSRPVPVCDDDPAHGGLSDHRYAELAEAGAALGIDLAARLLAAGAGEILGPLTAARASTYGAAEQPLDR